MLTVEPRHARAGSRVEPDAAPEQDVGAPLGQHAARCVHPARPRGRPGPPLAVALAVATLAGKRAGPGPELGERGGPPGLAELHLGCGLRGGGVARVEIFDGEHLWVDGFAYVLRRPFTI